MLKKKKKHKPVLIKGKEGGRTRKGRLNRLKPIPGRTALLHHHFFNWLKESGKKEKTKGRDQQLSLSPGTWSWQLEMKLWCLQDCILQLLLPWPSPSKDTQRLGQCFAYDSQFGQFKAYNSLTYSELLLTLVDLISALKPMHKCHDWFNVLIEVVWRAGGFPGAG